MMNAASVALIICLLLTIKGPAVSAFLVTRSATSTQQRTTTYQSTRQLQLHAEPLESGSTIVVCLGPTCKKTGGKKALALFEQFAKDLNVNVETVSCVSDCAECGLGPNVEIRKSGDNGPFYPIRNGIKTEEDVKSVLGID
jgi:hypothetical protein